MSAHANTGVCVIMAGGRGTRFWPLSRTRLPKQLLPLASPVSLLREAYDRVAPLVGPQRVLVITAGELADACREQLPELPHSHVIAEPVGRNTAPCAVLGLGIAARLAEGEPVALLPADHAVPDADIFREQLALAFQRARATAGVVTLGIPPSRPETGYGYLETGDEVAGVPDTCAGVAFVEKPDLARAEAYVEGGRHVWNSGIFVWDAAAFATAARTHCPEVVERLQPAVAAHGWPAFPSALANAYAACPSVSVDYAIMEKLDSFEVIRARFRWSDLGSWSAWGDLAPELEGDNRGMADLVAIDSGGNIVRVQDKMVALVGVDDLVVVDTGDALLICRKDQDQRVKDVIERLETGRRRDLL